MSGKFDAIDAGKLDDIPDSSRFPRQIIDVPVARMSTAKESNTYNMQHKYRGKCVIFNNKIFDKDTELDERKGTDMDAQRLYRRFNKLGFEEIEVCHNYTAHNILKTLEKIGKEDHTHRDCFVCCILTHGGKDILYGRDNPFITSQIYSPFKGDVCPSLAGKPKMFFIQACQGKELDSGVLLSADAVDKTDNQNENSCYKIPVHADFLVARSTIPGFFTWRHEYRGSWFIQALCQVLEKYGQELDLLNMLTIVNRIVSTEFESTSKEKEKNRKKQVPCVISMLTRMVYFPKKV